jgi:hypothetical protein
MAEVITPGAAASGSLFALLGPFLQRAKPTATRVLVLVDQLRGLPATRESMTTDCSQCGRDRVDVLRLTSRRARLACRACGAVVTIDDVGLLEPVAERRVERAPVLAAEEDEREVTRRLFMPAVMVEWAQATEAARAGRLDKASIYGLWKNFDRFLAAARSGGDARSRYSEWAVRAGVVDEVPEKLPSFGEIVGLLHAHCYLEETVIDALGATAGITGDALAERVRYARRWLAGPGREHCWIDRELGSGAIDADALRSLLGQGALEGSLTPGQRQALFAAAFGTIGGPPTGAILSRFGPGVLQRSVKTHLEDGSHSLRELVLRALGGGRDTGSVRRELVAIS